MTITFELKLPGLESQNKIPAAVEVVVVAEYPVVATLIVVAEEVFDITFYKLNYYKSNYLILIKESTQ